MGRAPGGIKIATNVQAPSPLACVIEEAVEPVGPSQNLVAQVVHSAQRAQVGNNTFNPLAVPFSLYELDGLFYGGFSAAVNDDARAFLGESRGRVPAFVWGKFGGILKGNGLGT